MEYDTANDVQTRQHLLEDRRRKAIQDDVIREQRKFASQVINVGSGSYRPDFSSEI